MNNRLTIKLKIYLISFEIQILCQVDEIPKQFILILIFKKEIGLDKPHDRKNKLIIKRF